VVKESGLDGRSREKVIERRRQRGKRKGLNNNNGIQEGRNGKNKKRQLKIDEREGERKKALTFVVLRVEAEKSIRKKSSSF